MDGVTILEIFKRDERMKTQNNRIEIGLGCRFKANCPLVRLGPIGGVPSVEVFQKDPSPYLREFWRKPRKTPNG